MINCQLSWFLFLAFKFASKNNCLVKAWKSAQLVEFEAYSITIKIREYGCDTNYLAK